MMHVHLYRQFKAVRFRCSIDIEKWSGGRGGRGAVRMLLYVLHLLILRIRLGHANGGQKTADKLRYY